MEWRNLYRGFFMGISDLIPGVSGRTVVFFRGVYDELVNALNGLFSQRWKEHLGFLLPLGLGLVAAFYLLGTVLEYLLKYYHEPIQYLFMGLIIGVIPYLSKQAEVKKNFRWTHVLFIIIIGTALAYVAITRPFDVTSIKSLTALGVVGLFLAGWAGGVAMLLPGINAPFIFLLLGVYSTAISAISNLNFPVIIVISAGIFVGAIASRKMINYVMTRFTHVTVAIIIGLIIGTIFFVYPGVPESGTPFVMSVIAFFTGLTLANVYSSSNKTFTFNH